MAIEFEKGMMELVEYFDFDNINTSAVNGIRWLVSSDAGDTAFARASNAAGPYATGALTTTDNNLIELAHENLGFAVQNGVLELIARVRVDQDADLAINVGFNDDALEDSNTLPVELATTTFTSNSSTFVGLVYDVDATNDNFHVFWVDDDVDTTEAIADLRMAGATPVDAQWMTLKVSLQDRGSGNQVRATFSVDIYDGAKVSHYEKVFNSTIDRDALLTPYFGFENRAGTAHTCDVGPVIIRKSLDD